MTRKQARNHGARLLARVKQLRLKLDQTEEKLRQLEIQGVIDLQIALNIKQENERRKLTLEMTSPKSHPHESLEYLRKTLLVVLSQRNHLAEREVTPQPLRCDYIQ